MPRNYKRVPYLNLSENYYINKNNTNEVMSAVYKKIPSLFYINQITNCTSRQHY